jgi:hypothetical protein
VLDDRALRDRRTACHPREDFGKCVPEVVKRRKNKPTWYAAVSEGGPQGRRRDVLPAGAPYAFACSLRRKWPTSVAQTAIYSREDGIVDWRRTGDPKVDVEVNGTHLGLIFNSTTYMHIAERLACAGRKSSLAEALVQFSGRKRFSSHFSTLG